MADISNLIDKLNQLVFYIELDICTKWSSFKKFEVSNQKQFLEKLKLKFLELMSKEQGTMDQLRKLTCEYQEIFILEEYCLLAFKRHFIYIAQKYLESPVTTENKGLVKLFVKKSRYYILEYFELKAESTE